MDGSLSGVSPLEWGLAIVVGIVALVIVMLFTSPFIDAFKKKH
jgi:hypothetical protein